MLRTSLRALALAACAMPFLAAPAAPQHENHGEPGTVAQAVLAGTVLCVDGAPLSGAIVQLLHGSASDRHIMATALTDASGRFVLRAASGTYSVEIIYIGHQSHEQTVSLTAAPLMLGSLRLQFSPVALDALAAAADRPSIQLRSGATIVNPAGVGTAAGGSIADLLRTIPGVELDADGLIAMRGSTSVLVLINGRRIPLTKDALAAFLKQMPATALERIEVGTSASARHDADGLAGVVNLVFRDDAARRTGTRSVAGSVATHDHYMAAAGGSGTVADALTWDALYSFSGMRPRTDSRTTRRSLILDDPVHHSEQESRARSRHGLHSIVAGAAVTPLAATSVGLRGTYTWMQGAYRNATAFANSDSHGATTSTVTRSVLEHTIPSGALAALLTLGSGAARFTAEARSSFVHEDFAGVYTPGAAQAFMTSMVARQREQVVQSDLRIQWRGTDGDIGQKYQRRTLAADYNVAPAAGADGHEFRYHQEVHAAYVAAHRMFGAVHADVALRAELDRTETVLDSVTTRTNLHVIPSISVQWPGSRRRGITYKLAYNRRISRPDTDALNPYSMGEDDMNEIIGNPLLLPEIADQLEVGIERSGALLQMHVTPFVRYSRNPIRPLKAVTESGRSTTTLQNLGSTSAAGADASVRGRLADHTVVTLAGSVYHMQTASDAYGSSGIYATARLNLDVRVAQNTSAQFYAYRRSAQAIEQGEIRPAFSSELALTHVLAGDRSRITLRLSDPLRTDRLAFRISDETFTQQSSRRVVRPILTLFASHATGGAPRDDVPVRSEGPARIF